MKNIKNFDIYLSEGITNFPADSYHLNNDPQAEAKHLRDKLWMLPNMTLSTPQDYIDMLKDMERENVSPDFMIPFYILLKNTFPEFDLEATIKAGKAGKDSIAVQAAEIMNNNVRRR